MTKHRIEALAQEFIDVNSRWNDIYMPIENFITKYIYETAFRIWVHKTQFEETEYDAFESMCMPSQEIYGECNLEVRDLYPDPKTKMIRVFLSIEDEAEDMWYFYLPFRMLYDETGFMRDEVFGKDLGREESNGAS